MSGHHVALETNKIYKSNIDSEVKQNGFFWRKRQGKGLKKAHPNFMAHLLEKKFDSLQKDNYLLVIPWISFHISVDSASLQMDIP